MNPQPIRADMNSGASVFHASNYKGNKGKMEYSIWLYFNTLQNSSKRRKGWHYVDPLQLLL
jgi:hypothetical protein